MGLNPIGASEFFLGFICNCLSYFTTAKIDLFHFYSLSVVHSCDFYHTLHAIESTIKLMLDEFIFD